MELEFLETTGTTWQLVGCHLAPYQSAKTRCFDALGKAIWSQVYYNGEIGNLIRSGLD